MENSPAAGAPSEDAGLLASQSGAPAATFHDGKITLHAGDCLDVLAQLPEASVDAVVTDPPYHLASIVKRFGKVPPGEPSEGASSLASQSGAPGAGKTGVYSRSARGFMGKQWDGGEIAHRPETWAAVLRVLKPGGHCVAFHASKNWAFQAVAMAQAGFELRDTITDLFDPSPIAAEFVASLSPAQAEAFAHVLAADDRLADLFWIYGSGFPKSLNVCRSIDKVSGESGVFAGPKTPAHAGRKRKVAGVAIHDRPWMHDPESIDRNNREYLPSSEYARRFEGFGTALKPAFEPIVLARKPLAEKSVAEQVLATGTGAINVGGCRIGVGPDEPESYMRGERAITMKRPASASNSVSLPPVILKDSGLGRWPANVTHDGSAAVEGGFPETGESKSSHRGLQHSGRHGGLADIGGNIKLGTDGLRGHDDAGGSAARFFYSSKADSEDRIGSKHPTVKPITLMRWLCRMVTPPGGVILDPFAGTGTTGEAALLEGFNAILIEREGEYRADIARRMEAVFAGKSARMKAKAARASVSPPMPLFAEPAEGGGDGSTEPSPINRPDRPQAMRAVE